MSDESEVRKRKPSSEEKSDNDNPKPSPPPQSSGGPNIWLLAAKLLLGASVVLLSLFIRGDFEQDHNKKVDKDKDDNFIPRFEKTISFTEPTGVVVECSREYWIQRDKWNKEFPTKRGNCLGKFCGRLVVDDVAEFSALQAYNQPVGILLKLVAQLDDYKAEWDMYFNTLTDPDFKYDPEAPEDGEDVDDEVEIDADEEEEVDSEIEDIPVPGETEDEAYERLQLAALDKQNEKEYRAEMKKKKEEAKRRRVWHQNKPGVAPIMFARKGFAEKIDSTSVWSMDLYHTQLTDIMNKIPNMIMNNFRSVDFVMTYPHKFVRHAAVPEGHEPFYSKPFLLGQGYADKYNRKARYPYVDFFAIIFISETEESGGGELVLMDAKTGKESVIEPRFNRAVVATAGSENIIKFNPVTKGELYFYFMTFTCDFRRNIGSEGKKDDEYLRYGPMRIPKEGITPIYIDEKRGKNYGSKDPTKGKARKEHQKQMDDAARNPVKYEKVIPL